MEDEIRKCAGTDEGTFSGNLKKCIGKMLAGAMTQEKAAREKERKKLNKLERKIAEVREEMKGDLQRLGEVFSRIEKFLKSIEEEIIQEREKEHEDRRHFERSIYRSIEKLNDSIEEVKRTLIIVLVIITVITIVMKMKGKKKEEDEEEEEDGDLAEVEEVKEWEEERE